MLRPERQYRIQERQCGVVLLKLDLYQRQISDHARQIGRQSIGSLEFPQRGSAVANALVEQAQVRMYGSVVLVEPHGPFIACQRGRLVALEQTHIAQRGVRIGKIRLDRNRPPEMNRRPVEITAFSQQRSEQIMRIDVVGSGLQDALE